MSRSDIEHKPLSSLFPELLIDNYLFILRSMSKLDYLERYRLPSRYLRRIKNEYRAGHYFYLLIIDSRFAFHELMVNNSFRDLFRQHSLLLTDNRLFLATYERGTILATSGTIISTYSRLKKRFGRFITVEEIPPGEVEAVIPRDTRLHGLWDHPGAIIWYTRGAINTERYEKRMLIKRLLGKHVRLYRLALYNRVEPFLEQLNSEELAHLTKAFGCPRAFHNYAQNTDRFKLPVEARKLVDFMESEEEITEVLYHEQENEALNNGC